VLAALMTVDYFSVTWTVCMVFGGVNFKSISFSPGSKAVLFQYVIGDSDLGRVDEINDLFVLIDTRMTFVDH
jgi:hypothetical protein